MGYAFEFAKGFQNNEMHLKMMNPCTLAFDTD